MAKAFLLLGSNEGERDNYINNARHRISLLAGKMNAASSVYETAAWGDTAQPPFLNQVVAVETLLEPKLLLATMQAIENSLGRKRNGKHAPRTIDIDILFYGDQIINEPDLCIPHPEIDKRRFTLVPLNEIAADLVHPQLKKHVSELLTECSDNLSVEKVKGE